MHHNGILLTQKRTIVLQGKLSGQIKPRLRTGFNAARTGTVVADVALLQP